MSKPINSQENQRFNGAVHTQSGEAAGEWERGPVGDLRRNAKCFLHSAMLIKPKDDAKPTITALELLLDLKTLSSKQREGVQDELSNVRAGILGGKEAAYHIDFKLKDAKNWVVMHDLRLEHNGRVAQIDHLLVGRFFDVFVIESKNLKTAVRVNKDDEFEVKTRWGWKGMASPVEQNKRHIQVLRELISDEKLMPTRLGMPIRPKFHNWVLVAPECNLVRGEQKEVTILKMDMFDKGLEQFINHSPLSEALSLTKLCSTDTIVEFGRKLASFHKPITFDYAAKFGVTTRPERVVKSASTIEVQAPRVRCESCEANVEPKVVAFCKSNEKRFAGKILCRTCQSTSTTRIVAPVPPVAVSGASCNQCHEPVDSKVVAFCRFNSRRFGKQILCRSCQSTAIAMN